MRIACIERKACEKNDRWSETTLQNGYCEVYIEVNPLSIHLSFSLVDSNALILPSPDDLDCIEEHYMLVGKGVGNRIHDRDNSDPS